jgi:hypothetical protein
VILPLLLLLSADTAAPPDTELLAKARANMIQILANQPNYVCIQTVDRSQRFKPKAKFDTIDSLRLEVAFVDKREMYAWPGSKKFDETNILDLVPEGSAIGTGAFAGHAQMLFRTSSAIINGGYWMNEGGKRQARFVFTVPKSRSHYQLLKSRKDGEVVGYSGDIWIEPETARVTRIDLHADDIPPRLEIQSTQTIIEYGETKIGERRFWLPAQSTEEITIAGGRTDRNITTFADCRAFSGASTLRFDDGPELATPPPEPAKIVELPLGAWFEIQFDAEIDSNRMHVGDAIPATLATDIKHEGQVLFVKGSTVEMRIIRIQHLQNWIGLEFALGDVTTPAATARLWALPVIPPGASANDTKAGVPRIDRDPKRPGLGTIYLKGSRLILRKGYKTLWTVVAAPASAVQKQERH